MNINLIRYQTQFANQKQLVRKGILTKLIKIKTGNEIHIR